MGFFVIYEDLTAFILIIPQALNFRGQIHCVFYLPQLLTFYVNCSSSKPYNKSTYYISWFGGKRGVRSAECGKGGVWKMRSVENEECGK